MSIVPDAEARGSHEVYRIYDVADRLLYVGMSHDSTGRINSHVDFFNSRVAASWLMACLMDSYHVERFPSRVDARAAETAAIRTEHPMFNKHHNGAWHLFRDTYFMVYGKADTVEESDRITRSYLLEDDTYHKYPTQITERPPVFPRDHDHEWCVIEEYVAKHGLELAVSA